MGKEFERLANFIKKTGKGLQITLLPDGISIDNRNDEGIPVDGWGWNDPEFSIKKDFNHIDEGLMDAVIVVYKVIEGKGVDLKRVDSLEYGKEEPGKEEEDFCQFD